MPFLNNFQKKIIINNNNQVKYSNQEGRSLCLRKDLLNLTSFILFYIFFKS